MLWQIDIYPAPGCRDRLGEAAALEAAELNLVENLRISAAHGYLVQGRLNRDQAQRLASELLADATVERSVVDVVGSSALARPPEGLVRAVHVLPRPGVMDPVAQSAMAAMAELGLEVEAARTLRKYWLADLPDDTLRALCTKVLANQAVEEVIVGAIELERLEVGSSYEFRCVTVGLVDLDDKALQRLSQDGQLYLSLIEMRAIQEHFRGLKRDPTDVELETIAQTWSEHCSHKTLKGRIHYRDERGERRFQNLLGETIFAATESIRRELGEADWCVSVFEDNAGIVRFDERHNLVFKVETHNHPSALEPYGGANTGIGGVIRDPLGTGLGAKPIASTDVFCFAPPDMPIQKIPAGVLHPKRVMKGVVAGVRDYGNRMGIPTVNGAIYFDPRYVANPLVYCGNVGLLPRDKVRKAPGEGDYIVVVGGRTGRDGIHGATFSSTELTAHSDELSGGAVQIGNAITEKMLVDVLLEARDRGLYNAITDCGAGGLSSAVGEMGAGIGAEVRLDRVPLKYSGLSYTEIWISEAQERMVLSVSPAAWPKLSELCASENVEATHIGAFRASGRLALRYYDHEVADLSMDFLHDGRPVVVREAVYEPTATTPLALKEKLRIDYTDELVRILGSLNVASKEWVIRQYDHEVQGGSVVKPLVGASDDGPSDAAVVRPVLGSQRGLVLACGMNPRYGDLDTYQMAASAIDEAVRNCVAVGADPRRIALLDNFCWGNTLRSQTLGSLVRAALACREVALVLGTPFISGKDSLNNEFHYVDAEGIRRSIVIPPSLLISAMGQIDDVLRAVTMDLKEAGNFLYQVGVTGNEMGGSHYALVESLAGGRVPGVDAAAAKGVFAALHAAIQQGLVRGCHDMSEGGLVVTVAEMAFAGDRGARVFLGQVPHSIEPDEPALEERRRLESLLGTAAASEPLHPLVGMPDATAILLFSESNTRFLCEVSPGAAEAFGRAMAHVPCALVGEVIHERTLEVIGLPTATSTPDDDDRYQIMAPLVIEADLATLKKAWQSPLEW